MSQVDISTLKQATSSDDSPTPGYLFNDISKATVSSYQFSNQLKDFLLNRIKKDNHNIKYKCLMIIKHVCRVGSVQFKRDISTNIEPIKECLQFKGIPDPLRGDEIYKRVREAAKEVIEIIFDGQTPSMMTSVAASQRIQGFGNTPMIDNITTTQQYINQSSSSSSSNNNNSSNSFSNTLMNTPLSLFGKKQDNLLLSNDNIYNQQQIVNTQNMYAAPQEYSTYNHLNTTSTSFPSSSNTSNNPSKMQGFGYTPETNTNTNTSTTTSELMAVTTAVTANVIKNVATSIINLSTGNKTSLTSSENSSNNNYNTNSSSGSSGSYNQGPLMNVYGQPIINSGSTVYPPVPSMTAGSTILPTATTNTTITSMYPTPITTVANTRIVPDIPTHSSGIGRTGQACTDGTYEIQLIQSLCNSGGVKMTLPEDRLQTFLQTAPTLNIDIVGDSLIQLLNDNNWQVRTKALLVIQELLQSSNHKSSHHIYVSYWITNESILTAMLSDPKVSVRTQAQKVIQLLHVHVHQSTDNSNTQIQYSSSSTSTSGNAHQSLCRSNMTSTQQVNTLPLIDLMNDITINNNSVTTTNNNNNNIIATNNNSLIQFDVHDSISPQVPTTNTIKSTDNTSTSSKLSMSGLFDGLSMSQSTHTNQSQSQNLSTLTTIPAQESSQYLTPTYTYTTNANTSYNSTISQTYPSTSLLASSSPSSVNPLLTVDIPLSTTTSSMPLPPPPPPIPTTLPTTQQMSIQSIPNTTMSDSMTFPPNTINTHSNDPRLINTATTNSSTTMTATNSSTYPMMMMMNNMTSPTYASPIEVSPLPPLPPATYIATQHTTGTMPLLQAPSRMSSLIHTTSTTTTTANNTNTNPPQTIPLSSSTTNTIFGNTNYGSSSNNIRMNNTSILTSNILSNTDDGRNTTVRNIGQTMMSSGVSNTGSNSSFTFLKQDTSQATSCTTTTATSNTSTGTILNNKVDPFQVLENELKTSLSSTNSTNSNTNSSSSFTFVTKSKP